MRTLTVLLSMMALALLCLTESHSQIDEFDCGTVWDEKDPMQQIDLQQFGGIYLTAEGTIKMLVVFVSFPDDEEPHDSWPVGEPPINYDRFIDADVPPQDSNYHANLTNFFYQMSVGQYNVIGEAIWVTALNPTSYYGSNYGLANREVLRDVVDPLIDFSEYDNWTRLSDYNHVNEPDGIVDMIIMVYRGYPFGGGWVGVGSLGGGAPLSVDGVEIRFSRPNGSGVTNKYPSWYWHEREMQVIVHELGHWLLGGPHMYAGAPRYAVWGMMAGHYPGGYPIANAWERQRLAWIYPIPINETAIVNIPDFITTGIAYKYRPPNGEPNEWYYFENHQKLSVYDDQIRDNDKGIYVIHQRGPYNSTNNIRIKPTDGFWNWETPELNTSCFPPHVLGEFRKESVNRVAGRSIRSELLVNSTPSAWQWPHVYRDRSNVQWCGGFFRGDPPFLSAYNLNEEKVISPWSNPTTHTWGGDSTTFAMEVLSQSGSVINVKFHTTNPEDAPPSKPQDLRASIYNPSPTEYYPRLTWAAMVEPDVTPNGKIFIERRLKLTPSGWGGWQVKDSLAGSGTEYTDYSIPTAGWGNDSIQYRIRARDTQNKFSVYSDVVSLNWSGTMPWKTGTSPENLPTFFALEQNYPNPFNPSTVIRYQLPVESYVSLKVYDLLGREVATLVNETKDAGYFETSFDASALGSGVYFYRMVAGSFTQVRKFVVMK